MCLRLNPATSWLGVLLSCSALLLGSARAAESGASDSREDVLFEGFEQGELSGWSLERNHTEATATLVRSAGRNGKVLRIEKPDDTGNLSLIRRVPVRPEADYVISYDIRSDEVSYTSGFYLLIAGFAEGKSTGEYHTLYFDNRRKFPGVGRESTPVTLGRWQTSRHLLKGPRQATEWEVRLIVKDGRQKFSLDNLSIRKAGAEYNDTAPTPVFQQTINQTQADIELFELVPGFTYRFRAALTSTENGKKGVQGLSAELRFSDRHGNPLENRQILLDLTQDWQGGKIVVGGSLAVPDLAYSAHLQLGNTDEIQQFKNPKTARTWKEIEITELGRGLILDELVQQRLSADLEGREIQADNTPMTKMSAAELKALKQHLARRTPVNAEVMLKNGGMSFSFEGKPVSPFMTGSFPGLSAYQGHELLVAQGAEIVRASLKGGGPSNQWIEDGKYDFSELDEAVYLSLLKNPDAYVYITNLVLVSPPWWGEKHPDAIMRTDDQKGLITKGPYMFALEAAGVESGEAAARVKALNAQRNQWEHRTGNRHMATYVPSLASEAYRRDMGEYLKALADHIQRQPYSGAVVGFHLSWGFDGQWNYPLLIFKPPQPGQGIGKVPDYSPAMLQRSRQFLREKYQTDEALRKAWGDTGVTIDTATIPSQKERDIGKAYLNPESEQRVIDYNFLYANLPAEAINEFAMKLKGAFSRKVLVGGYYNDIAVLSGSGVRPNGQREILKGKGIDLFTGPSYDGRSAGMPGSFTYMPDSYRLHEKLLLTEVDHRPFTLLSRSYSGNEIFDTPEKSVAVLQREFMAAICRGHGLWTLDLGLGGGWFHAPLILDTFKELLTIQRESLEADRSSIAKMAVFAGYESKNFQGTAFNGGYPRELLEAQRVRWNQAGVPIDQYLLSDLPGLERKYQIYIIMMGAFLRPDELQAIEALKRDGNILVFYNATNIITAQSATDAEAMSRLIGMQVAISRVPLLKAKVAEPVHALFKNAPKHLGVADFGKEAGFPSFYVTDEAATPLLTFDNGKTAAAIRQHEGWTSVFYAPLGQIPEEFYANLAELKGIHAYNKPGDAMYFCQDYIGIHAARTGDREIRLPGKFRVKEIFSGKNYGVTDSIPLNMKVGENAFFRISPEPATQL